MELTDRGTVATLALAIALPLTLAACQGGMTIPPSRSPTAPSATTSPLSPQTGFATEVLINKDTTVADVTLAPDVARDALATGILTDQRTVASTDSHGKTTFASTIMDDGTVVGSQSASQPQGPDETTLSQVSVGLIDASSAFAPFPAVDPGALESKGVDPAIGRQAGYFDTRRRVVAWAETSSTDVVADNWVVFTHDLDTGTTAVLGSSNELVPDGHLPGVGPDASPSIGSSRVFWGTTSPLGKNDAGGAGQEILAAPIDGASPPTVVAKGAVLPAADGDCVVFARVWGYDESAVQGEIMLARICGNSPEEPLAKLTVGADGSIGNLVADGGRVAWSTVAKEGQVEGHREVTVLDLATGALTSVNLSASADAASRPVAEMRLDGSLLQWTTDGSHMVLDLSDNSLWSLPASEGYYGAYGANGWVGWRAPVNSSTSASTAFARWSR